MKEDLGRRCGWKDAVAANPRTGMVEPADFINNYSHSAFQRPHSHPSQSFLQGTSKRHNMSSPQNLETEANQDYHLEPHISPKFCTKCEYIISTFKGAVDTKELPFYEDSSLTRASAEAGCLLCGQNLELIECTEIKETVAIGTICLELWFGQLSLRVGQPYERNLEIPVFREKGK